MKKKKPDHSDRKRLTEWIANHIGFKYDTKRYPYGGHFSVEQLLRIQAHIMNAENPDEPRRRP